MKEEMEATAAAAIPRILLIDLEMRQRHEDGKLLKLTRLES